MLFGVLHVPLGYHVVQRQERSLGCALGGPVAGQGLSVGLKPRLYPVSRSYDGDRNQSCCDYECDGES